MLNHLMFSVHATSYNTPSNIRVILYLNGTFHWKLAPYYFPLVCFANKINNLFLLVVHAQR